MGSVLSGFLTGGPDAFSPKDAATKLMDAGKLIAHTFYHFLGLAKFLLNIYIQSFIEYMSQVRQFSSRRL